MRNFCNIFFINFSNISGNYFLILSDQTGRFPFYQRKTPQYFIPGSSTLHQRVLLPFFFLTFPYPFPFFFCLFLHQNVVTAPSFSILCSITNRTLFNKQYDFFSKIININLISISYSVEQSNIFLQENAFHLIAV